jgi:DNA-binding transcriptional ArsR family regulator
MSLARSKSRGKTGEVTFKSAAPLFAALGDVTRLEVVARLSAAGPMSIARITAGSGVTRQAVSKHLRVLEGAGLVRGGRAGRESVWTLAPEQLETARQSLDLISRRWDEALGRLRALVEE